jgi:protein-tyrosine phosphatase
VIHRAVQALVEGGVAGLPFDTTYALCALAVELEAARKIAACGENSFLAVGNAETAADYIPRPSKVQSRLMQRCWPGSLLLQFPEEPRPGLAAALPEPARRLIVTDGCVRLNVPQSTIVRDVLHLLPAPLVVVAPGGDARAVLAAADLPSRFPLTAEIGLEAGPPGFAHPPSIVRALVDHWELVSEGSMSAEEVTQRMATVILFVCTGNTCRSPMAEALFRKLLAGRLQCREADLVERGFLVQSAGLSAVRGMPAAREATALMERHGARLDRHASQPVTEDLLARADYVLTMTERHQFALQDEYPESASRVRLLSTEGRDIEDPIGAGAAEYRRCCDQIMGYLRELLKEVVPRASKDDRP